jgi:hypothetical protein
MIVRCRWWAVWKYVVTSPAALGARANASTFRRRPVDDRGAVRRHHGLVERHEERAVEADGGEEQRSLWVRGEAAPAVDAHLVAEHLLRHLNTADEVPHLRLDG